jgi:hypothetical protein
MLRIKTDRGLIRSDTAQASIRGASSTSREQSATLNGGVNAISLTGETGEIVFIYGRR